MAKKKAKKKAGAKKTGAKKAGGSSKGRKKPDLLQVLIRAAENHGMESEPDHEVGDLQDLLSMTWPLLTKKQQNEIAITALVNMGLAQHMDPRQITVGGMKIGKF